jgi:hypothetical protein
MVSKRQDEDKTVAQLSFYFCSPSLACGIILFLKDVDPKIY